MKAGKKIGLGTTGKKSQMNRIEEIKERMRELIAVERKLTTHKWYIEDIQFLLQELSSNMSSAEYHKLRMAETYWEMLDRLPEFTILERMAGKWHLYDGYENFVDDIQATPSCNTPAEALHKYWESKK